MGQALDEGTDLDELIGVEAGGGLVQDEQFGVTDEGLRQADTLAIAFAQFADMFVPLGRETDEIYKIIYDLTIGQPRHELKIFGDVHLLVEGIILRQITDRRRHRDCTAVGFPKPHEDLHERRFAGSVRT